MSSTGRICWNRRTAALSLAASLLLSVLVLIALLGHSRPGHTPMAAATVALKPGQPTAARIEALQALVKLQPANAELTASLGLAYYQRVRETGDFSYYVKAEGVLRTALEHQPANVTATVGMATIALARHDFPGGLRYALAAHRLDPSGVQAYPGMIDGLVELGRYDEAGKAIQRFVNLRPTLASYARISYFRELHGDLVGASDAMQYAVSAGGDAPENVAYIQTLLGDLEFVRGRVVAARRAYGLALDRVNLYPLAEVGLAQTDAAEGRLPIAITRLRDVVSRLPLPQYIVALGEYELAAHRTAAARSDFAVIGAEERLLKANGVNTDVDLAQFEASHGDPRRALLLAKRAWHEAPSVRSADALGWALTSAGSARAGLGWARRALRLGSLDPLFLYHAGISAKRAGSRQLARTYLHRAIGLNPNFSPYYAPLARRALKGLA